MVTARDTAKTDDEGVMTEPAAVSEPGTAVTQPIPEAPPAGGPSPAVKKAAPEAPPAGGPATAVALPLPVVAESCSQCSAPLVADQRYCLQCGAPRAHVMGPIAGARPRGPVSQATSFAWEGPRVPPGPQNAPPSVQLGAPFALAQPSERNNTLALFAGIGVLLLAMGVGVLIGRAGAGSAKVPPAQVISVGGSPAGGSAAPTTSTPTTEVPASSAPKKKEAAKAKGSSAPGSSIAKPAPPSAAKNLRSGSSGQSYEQKSKNLPNVVGT